MTDREVAMKRFIIDVKSHDTTKLIRRLDKLVSTESVRDGGEYIHCQGYNQVHLVSSKTEDEIERWLWEYSNMDYVGVVEVLHD